MYFTSEFDGRVDDPNQVDNIKENVTKRLARKLRM